MARFDANTTFRQMWLSMDKNIDWAKGPEGQKLLRTIKAKGSAPSFGTGSLYGDFQNDLLTGSGKVRNQVADMYKQYYGVGDSSAPASSQPSPSSRSSALARTSGRGSVVRQSAPTSTNAGTPSSNGGGLARTSRHQGGARARQGVSVRGGGVPTPGNPGGYGTPRVTPKPSSVTSSVPAGGGSGRGLVRGLRNVATGGLKGSLVVGAVDALADLAVPHISREAVRGALVVTGNDTTGFDKLMSGKPVVKNIGGVSYNIATEEGRKGYNAALSENPEELNKKSNNSQRGSGLTFDESGRPYINVGGRRVYQGEAANKYNETEEAAVDNAENLEETSYYTGKEKAKVLPTTPPAPTERKNENGITQKGRVLSSSDMASLGLMDASRFWDSEIAAGDASPAGKASININGKPYELTGEDLVEYQEAQTELGGDPRTAALVPQSNPLKPVAPATPWSKVELTEEDEAYVSPMYANAARNAARSAFLNAPAGQGTTGPINARNRAVGGDYENGFNVGGQNYQWADGVDQRQKSAAMYALSGGAGNTQEGFNEFAQQFLKDYMKDGGVQDTPSSSGVVGHTPQTARAIEIGGKNYNLTGEDLIDYEEAQTDLEDQRSPSGVLPSTQLNF